MPGTKESKTDRNFIEGTSKNPYLRATASRIACLPRFVTIRRCSKNVSLHINHRLRQLFLFSPRLV